MSPFSNIWARNRGGSTTSMPADDLQLRVQVSRDSETTATPSLDARTSSTPTLSPPQAHHSPRQLYDDALGEFFGGRDHRARTQPRGPPPSSPEWDGEKLPKHGSPPDFETVTVARLMFKYGFFFPAFWVIGVYFLFVPMRMTPEWQSHKTEAEKQQILSEMRETEAKWAKRCLYALLSFLVCLAILIVAVVLLRR